VKRLEIMGYLIVQLEGQLSPLEAVRELVENCLDANASVIDIKVTSRSMSICDNGDGTNDPNLLATPSASISRHKKGKTIGSKGAGAKQAMATFGRVWDIHTVPLGHHCYHHYKVKWDENGPLPEQYDSRSRQPTHNAPANIRAGGTMITVTERQDGVPDIRIDSLARELETNYRPALSGTSLAINLSNPEKNERKRLSNSALDLSKFIDPPSEIHDKIGGREFSVRYGSLKASDSILSGCHFIFGPRVIQTVGEIADLSLPSGCYIDVSLGEKWKTLLSTNKSRFRHRDELNAKLKDLLQDWIAAQATQAKIFRMNLLSGKAVAPINETILFLNKMLDGEYGQKPNQKKDAPSPIPKPPTPKPDRIKFKRHAKAHLGGDFGLRKVDSKQCLRLRIEPDVKLAEKLYRVSFIPGEIVVYINVGEKQRTISDLYNRNKNVEDQIRQIGIMAYAHIAAENKTDLKFLPLWAALQKLGYELDENSDRSDIVSMVANFFIDDLYDQRKNQTREVA
jgi:hypothetical protein